MAKRCPESRYIGTAILHNYRFQINQRGYANVLPSPGDCVEGLVYLLSLTDEARLDKNEGVPTAYQKCILPIEIFTAAINYVGRAVPEMAQRLDGSEPQTAPLEASTKSIGSRSDSLHDTNKQIWADEQIDTPAGCDGSRRLGDYVLQGQFSEALVYVSHNFVQDSEPQNEYIGRMNVGIIDARKLGMSDTYVDACLRRYIRDPKLPN